MLNRSHLLLGSCLFLLFTQAIAVGSNEREAVRYYDIEIIVFKNKSVPRGHEFNLPTPSATQTENMLDLSSAASIELAQASGFTPLTQQDLKLQETVKKIINSSRYNLLTHTGWRQPGLKEEKSIPVWIKGGRVFGSGYSSIDQMTITSEPAVINSTVIQIPADENKRPPKPDLRGLYELEGQITITLSRYLHTKAELVLRKPADPATIMQQSEELTTLDNLDSLDIEGQLLLNYGLKEQRRMRSKRLHYLDHPEFGMLVLITPYEIADTGDSL